MKRGSGARAGAYALSLLARPLNPVILRALAAGPRTMEDLLRGTGCPPQTTLRRHLAALVAAGIVAKERKGIFPGIVSYALQKSGQDLAHIADGVENWLAIAPRGPIELGSVAAKSALMALVDGWSTTLILALVASPMNLTELDGLISGVSYPSLERRLAAMRIAGQVEARPGRGRGTPYAVTPWLRQAVAPLVAAACWERRYLPAETAPIRRLDIESAFLLAVPPLTLPADVSGLCRLSVAMIGDGEAQLVGVLVGVEGGRIASCRTSLDGDAAAWASGSVSAWLEALGHGGAGQLEIGGDSRLAGAFVQGLGSRPD